MEGMNSEWRRLPESVRLWVAGSVGGRVLGFDQAEVRDSGEIVGVVRSIRGPLVLRAAPVDSPAAGNVQFDARVSMALPPEVPAAELVRAGQTDGWIAVIFEQPDGHIPAQPWRSDELSGLLNLLDELTGLLTPSPIEGLPTIADRIPELAEVAARWESNGEESTGEDDTLLHFDLQPGNLRLSRRGQLTLLNWGSACVGPAWIDTVSLLLAGDLGALDADQFFRGTQRGATARPADVDAVLEALAGSWTDRANDAAVPEAQRARYVVSADAAKRWLQQRRA
jgi:hypothetical protein